MLMPGLFQPTKPAVSAPSPNQTHTETSPAAQNADTARSAGRGGLAIAVAKVSFILFGFAQQIILPRLLGVDGYGEVSRVLAVISIVNNIVVAVGIQGVSRTVSGTTPDKIPGVFRRALLIHTAVAALLSLGFAILAPTIASFIGAPHIAVPLRVSAAIILLYGIYAPLVGSLNGRRRFLDQAGLDILYGVLRTSAIAFGAILFLRGGGSGVTGAIVGFVSAAFIIVPLALTRSGLGKGGETSPKTSQYLSFLLLLSGGQIFLNLLLQTDFMLLSRFSGLAALAQGKGPDASDQLMGIYRGAQLFAFLPYQLLMSITFILFPMLAKAHAERDTAAVTRFTQTGVRLSFLLTGLFCGTVSALAPHLLRFAFPEEIWTGGGTTLRILSLGLGTFAILGITCAALTSLGRERETALLTLSAVVLIAGTCTLTLPQTPFGRPMLHAAAACTSLSLLVICVVGAFRLKSVAGGFVSPLTLLRVVIATGLTLFLGMELPWMGKLFVPLQAVIVAVFYMIVLTLSRELGRSDLGLIRKTLGKQ